MIDKFRILTLQNPVEMVVAILHLLLDRRNGIHRFRFHQRGRVSGKFTVWIQIRFLDVWNPYIGMGKYEERTDILYHSRHPVRNLVYIHCLPGSFFVAEQFAGTAS